VPSQYAKRLWRLVHEKKSSAVVPIGNARPENQLLSAARSHVAGAGFGDEKTNALVEQAAIRKVSRFFKQRGFTVRSRELENLGYDLDVAKRRTEWHVEVKGVSGEAIRFIISKGELARAESDAAFRLVVVTRARTRNARVREFPGPNLTRLFALTPVNYFAELK